MFAKIRTLSANKIPTQALHQCHRLTVVDDSSTGLCIIIDGDLTLDYDMTQHPHFDLWIMNDAGKTIDHRGWKADFPVESLTPAEPLDPAPAAPPDRGSLS